TERHTLTAAPGQSVPVAVSVTRGKGLEGPVKVELIAAAHLRGVTAEPGVIPAGQDRGTLALRFPADARGPYNLPVVLRATAVQQDEPVIAETKVEILPGR